MEVKRILFAEAPFAIREGCMAVVAEIDDNISYRMLTRDPSPDGNGPLRVVDGWSKTPIEPKGESHRYYESAFGGCNSGEGSPLGDFRGALIRPGSYYRIINGGEGIAILNPAANLAGFFYFG